MVREQAYDWHPITRGKAVFSLVGDKYYLKSISVPDNSSRLIFATPTPPRRPSIAATNSPETVELALLSIGR